jgi:hypothetical protein
LFGVICIVRVIYMLVIFPNDSIGTCPDQQLFPDKDLLNYSIADRRPLRGSCYFSDSYNDANALFLKSAELCNATISRHFIDENLFTTVAVLKGSNEKFLIHLSGTHGVEGYAGSAIQSAILQYLHINDFCARETVHRPTIVFVHAVNPYVSMML